MISLSEQFLRKSGQQYLTNINHVANIQSIMQLGLLCHAEAAKVHHRSVAIEDVQLRRKNRKIINGMSLHQYVCLYFAPRNPMMFYLKCHPEKAAPEELCVLMISPDVLDLEGVIVTDGNAADDMTRFFSPEEGMASLNYDGIYAKYWNDPNLFVKEEKKRIKCAEVLVPGSVSYDMIEGALVPCEKTETVLRSLGFSRKIIIHPDTFFQ